MDISFNPNLSTSGNDFDDLQNPQSLARRLETSEARIYGLLATLPQIVWLAQVNGSVTNFNPRWYEYTGLTASESLGWGFLKAIHPEDRDGLQQSYLASAVLGESKRSDRQESDPIECRIRGSDGTYRWFMGQRMPVRGTQGQILEWVGIYTLKDQTLYSINHSVSDPKGEERGINPSVKRARAAAFALFPFVSSSSPLDIPVCFQDAKSSGRGIELTPVFATGNLPPATLSRRESALADTPVSAQYRHGNWVNELSHTIIWETDAITEQFTFVSHSAEQVLGYPVEQWLENPDFWVNLIHPEDRQWTVAVCRKKVVQDRDYELEYRCLTADQRVVWLRDRGYVIRDEQGRVHKRRGLMVDITFAKQAEVELQARLRQQAAIAQLGQQALLRAPVSTLMDECLALICQILGVEYCQVWEWLPDDNSLKLRAGIGWQEGLVGQALIDASPNTQAGYTLQSGQSVVVENLSSETRFQGSPLLHEHGIRSGISVMMGGTSLTQPLEREDDIGDPAGVNQEQPPNSSTQAELPPSAPALLPQSPQSSSLHRATLSPQPWGVLAAHTTKQRVFSQSDVDFLQSVANVLAGAMQAQQTDAALHEVTAQLAQTTAALEKRSKELDEFAYITSHDLKAPLRAIANLSQWIEEDIANQLNAENRHQLQLLRGRVYRLEVLIEGLLQYSRAGRLKSEPQLVDVALLLQQVIHSLNPPIQFRIMIAPGMPTLLTERLPLEQVFTHLIDNAIKHHPLADGTVKIDVEEQSEAYTFTVVDDGLGIKPQFHERVFGIFQTLQAKDSLENTGLGLAIAKRIVEGKGGTIRLESQEGQGTTFYFTWPKVLR
ncbi:MAG TPA: PAS domain-containing protein [Stenomitos sp.]